MGLQFPYLIPMSNTPQTFGIVLVGVSYNFTVKWNDMVGAWYLDIADSNNNSIVAGLPMVVGIDLLDGLAYLGIQGQLYVLDNNGNIPADMPTLDNLGVDNNLYFYTTVPNG